MRSDGTSVRPKLVVAVNFNAHMPALLKQATSLCEASGMDLHIFHALDTTPMGLVLNDMGHGMSEDFFRPYEEKALKDAKTKLSEYAQNLECRVKITIEVTTGSPAEGAVSEVLAHDAKLILCGAAAKSYRYVPKGYSTALTLMAISPVPVLIITEGHNIDFKSKSLKLLVSDDLRPETASLVDGAFSFISSIGGGHVHHVYVNPLTIATISSAMSAAREESAEDTKELSPTDLYAKAGDYLQRKVSARAASSKKNFGTWPGTYTSKVLTGGVSEHLESEIEMFKPDICAFGRHNLVHHNPFAFGSLSFRTMLSQGLPIFIVPPQR